MLEEYLSARISIQIDNKNQWTELKKLCKEKDMRIVKYGEDRFVYPVQSLITFIGATGQAIICPSKDNASECEKRGWKIVSFKNFKGIVSPV